jgi:hypothetical protein
MQMIDRRRSVVQKPGTQGTGNKVADSADVVLDNIHVPFAEQSVWFS